MRVNISTLLPDARSKREGMSELGNEKKSNRRRADREGQDEEKGFQLWQNGRVRFEESAWRTSFGDRDLRGARAWPRRCFAEARERPLYVVVVTYGRYRSQLRVMALTLVFMAILFLVADIPPWHRHNDSGERSNRSYITNTHCIARCI